MATNLGIDDRLLNHALEVGGFHSKKETVTVALEEFIQRRKAEDLIALFGQVEYADDYDYKDLRQGRERSR